MKVTNKVLARQIVFTSLAGFSVFAFAQAFYHFSCASQACSPIAWGVGLIFGAILLVISFVTVKIIRATATKGK
jgi:hypothetical protein